MENFRDEKSWKTFTLMTDEEREG